MANNISYNQTIWINNQTKLNANNMNNIENGISAICSVINNFPLSGGGELTPLLAII